MRERSPVVSVLLLCDVFFVVFRGVGEGDERGSEMGALQVWRMSQMMGFHLFCATSSGWMHKVVGRYFPQDECGDPEDVHLSCLR